MSNARFFSRWRWQMTTSTDRQTRAIRSLRIKRRLCVAMVAAVSILCLAVGATWWQGRPTIRQIDDAQGRYSWSKSGLFGKRLSELPSLTRRTLGNLMAFDSDVATVAVQGPNADDALMSKLSKLPDLRILEMFDASVTDAGLAELARSRSLRCVLLMHSTKFTDSGLASLQPLRRLWKLAIVGTPLIEGSGLAGLSSVGNLEVSGCMRFDDTSLARLSGLTRMNVLHLCDTSITIAGMEHLVHFPNLEHLGLQTMSIDDTGIATIVRTCPQLESISLVHTGVTEAGFTRLADLKRLKRVDISAGTASPAAIGALKSLRTGVTVHER
jgi:hypothetical protein